MWHDIARYDVVEYGMELVRITIVIDPFYMWDNPSIGDLQSPGLSNGMSLEIRRGHMEPQIGSGHLVWISGCHVMLVSGIPTPLKNMKVGWDDEIPNIYMEKWKLFQTTNQDVIALIRTCTRISSLSYPVSYILFNGCDFRAKSKIIQRKTKQTALANSKEWTATPLLHEIVQSWLLRFLYIYIYPLVNCPITMEDHNFEWVNQLFLWPF